MHRNIVLVISNKSSVKSLLSQVVKNYVPKVLYIHLRLKVPAQQQSARLNRCQSPNFSSVVSNIYAKSLEISENYDIRVLLANLKTSPNQICPKLIAPIDTLIYDRQLPADETNSIENCYEGRKTVVVLNENNDAEDQLLPNDELGINVDTYDNVVLGGTFDRLHVGHKILLSEAVLRARVRLVVGVTDTNMVQSKKLPELILPVAERIQQVHNFLTDIDPTLIYEIVPIQDPFGPTKSDPNMDLIVVSEETFRGGEKVNELRVQNHLNPLKIHCIKLVEIDPNVQEKEVKVSSSNRRMDMLGVRIKSVVPKPHLPPHPYIIGLMGGIASGKTIMSERFRKLGAKVIDCDKIAHEIYEPGLPCFDDIISKFGNGILNAEGKIDRKKLGSIVFSHPKKLNELNAIVWPHILHEVKRIIQVSSTEYEVIILEAAILFKAGWQSECHEVWSCIVPRNEAIKRIVERNSISEEDAKKRVDAQIDNETLVKNSNVVFSTMWSFEYSQRQAERAWASLMDNIKSKTKL